MQNKIAPETISPKFILYSTYYDNMSNEDRETVFKAYEFNRKKEIYELKKPKLLTKDIIEKLIIH